MHIALLIALLALPTGFADAEVSNVFNPVSPLVRQKSIKTSMILKPL